MLKLTLAGVRLPFCENMSALHMFWMGEVFVTSKYPNAPEPLACTTRSDIRSLSKCAMWSMSAKSWSTMGPCLSAVVDAVRESMGASLDVVSCGRD